MSQESEEVGPTLEGVTFPNKSLVGVDGNAFAIIGFVTLALRRAGNPLPIIERYQAEATSGDYEHVLRVSVAYLGAESALGEDE